MRRILTRAPVLILTFSIGLCLTLLWGLLISSSVRWFAHRAWPSFKMPGVARVEKEYRDRRILFDKRDYGEDSSSTPYDDLEANAKERDEIKRRILPKLFPGGHLKSYGECSERSREKDAETEADLAWAREQKQFVAWLPGWHKGSFTEPGAYETLYEIDVGECNARSGPLAGGSKLLAVFRWDELRATFNPLPSDAVYDVRDIDGDDVDEVLLGTAELRESSFVTKMRLVSFKGGVMRVIHDFGDSYVYLFGDPVGHERVFIIPVIYYTPRGEGLTPEFQVDYYRARCRKDEGCGFFPRPSAWQYFKSGSLNE